MGSTYRAFISYSHSDAPCARWLHSRLESYRLPGGVDQVASAGGPQRRLGPIFRDREELPASEDLSASVRAALAASDVLVVLCSPEARASRWVAREIELFREIGPDRPILAAIVRGEPGEAFPEPLLEGREPLAADLRKRGDGRRLGFLKIVAGIAGVPLDALDQRDAQRHLRRVTAVTLVTATAAIMMAIMTMLAIQSRNEADRQRGEAVALAKYMSTDLRDKLRGVGRLDLMRDVVERALAYCDGEGDWRELPADGLESCAQSHHAEVEIELSSEPGDLRAAADGAAQAYLMTASLLEISPRNAEFVFDHAQSEYWRGYVAYFQGDRREARVRWSAYRDLARALVASDSGDVRWQRELGYAEGNMCTVLFKRPDEAIGHCQKSWTIFRTIAGEMPRDVDTLITFANRTGWLADAKLAMKRADEALALRQEQLTIVERALALDSENAQVREAHMLALIGLGGTALEGGHETVARTAIRQARRLADALHRQDRANTDWASWQEQVAQLEAKLTFDSLK